MCVLSSLDHLLESFLYFHHVGQEMELSDGQSWRLLCHLGWGAINFCTYS